MKWGQAVDFMRQGGCICPVEPHWSVLAFLYIKGECLWAANNLKKSEFIKDVPDDWKRWEWKDYYNE